MAATTRSANAVRSAAPRFLRTPEGGGFRAEVFMNRWYKCYHSTSFQISGCISPASAPISAKIVTARFS